jgi:hypothetical protein
MHYFDELIFLKKDKFELISVAEALWDKPERINYAASAEVLSPSNSIALLQYLFPFREESLQLLGISLTTSSSPSPDFESPERDLSTESASSNTCQPAKKEKVLLPCEFCCQYELLTLLYTLNVL